MQTAIRRTIALVIAIALTVGVGVVAAQDNTDDGTPTRTIQVTGSGSAFGDPDQATMILGVETINQDVSAAYADVNSRVDSIVQSLISAGLAQEDIQTADLNIFMENRQQMAPPPGAESMPNSFRVMNRVSVIVRDLDNLENIIDTAVNAGANSLFGINFSLSDPAALESEARTEALEQARVRAQEYADALGVTLGDVQMIVEDFGGFVGPAAEARGMGGGGMTSIQRGQLAVTINVRVTYEMN